MAAELSRRRWGGGGLLLLILLAVLLVAPLFRHRGMDHPLAGSQLSNLCPLLPPPPTTLQDARAQPQAVVVGSATCRYSDEHDQPVLDVTLSSTRQMSQGGPAHTDKMFDTWMKEVRASYGNGAELAGEWKHGGAWHSSIRQSVLFEDGGVLVALDSSRLDAEALASHARRVQQALRQAAATSSSGASSP